MLQVQKDMEKAGLEKVELEFYLGGRHDILHEEESGTAGAVRERILEWMRLTYGKNNRLSEE